MPNDLTTIDPWSWYDFKPVFGHANRGMYQVPGWIGHHDRRLQAYKLLESYYRNLASNWLDSTVDAEERSSRREYGDPQVVCNTIKSSVIGNRQTIVVGLTEEERLTEDAKVTLALLMQWVRDEAFRQKFLESELASVKLGDSVYVLGWDPDKMRPRLEVWDPGFYFPVLDPARPVDEWPRKVHIAYQYETEDDSGKKVYVRRITWELVELDEKLNLPWGKSNVHCLMSDATWLIDDQKQTVEDFTMEKAIWATYVDPVTGDEEDFNEIDLGIDFLPVIHVPNTPAKQEHFGTSSMAPVMQIFDDLVNTDTDLQASSATTGSPPIALSGSSAPKDEHGKITSYGPGTVLETGDGGATVIDTSRSLDALLKYDDHLLERLSVNGRIPESLLGRVKPSEVPSGITLALSFAPHTASVEEMREVRDEKYPILFKFVMRMYILWGKNSGVTLPKKILDINLKLGSFLPSDKKETCDLVQQLRSATPVPAISLLTAVQMLIDAGFSIEDAGAEVQRIENRDFAGANEILSATGNVDEVAKYLNMKVEEPEPDPTIDPETGLPVEQPPAQ